MESGNGPVGEFARDILVCCPRCGAAAHVRDLVRLVCPRCNLLQSRVRRRLFGADGASYERAGSNGDWYGAFTLVTSGSERCDKCGNGLTIPKRSRPSFPPVATHAVSLDAQCETCAAVKPVAARWVPRFQQGEPRDPAFGCALYLQEETGRGTLWAYNRAHALALLEWIASPARSRDGAILPGAMASRLPGWMKSAANRTAVEKSLGRLVARAAAI